ncbi:MAG: 7-carboxy-7-deazaguanine synthase [Betaproteobacteria bacterium]|jgi:7-carboxy-7-deazaguanine synthase (Cx14CxxC type)|nr:7-carboxy-7-deazaguanine synthase [Betaproteobacteria bacterium]
MGYKLKESFLTLQGEGARAGRLSVFLRFSGCNNWSGREQDRQTALADCARWCDTQFVGTDGDGGGDYSLQGLTDRVQALWPAAGAAPYVVLTGGEPALQVDEALVRALKEMGAEVAIETNGSLPLPSGLDWVCVSPKRLMNGIPQPLNVTKGHEIKLVLPQPGLHAEPFEALAFDHYTVQPMDGPEAAQALQACLDWIHAHPKWRLSVQTHKVLGLR